MFGFIEEIVTYLWSVFSRRRDKQTFRGITLGFRVRDKEVTRTALILSDTQRSTHVATLGMTGSGKSSFLKSLAGQDIAANRGFLYFDLHGDSAPFLLHTIAAEEERRHEKLDEQTILIAPGAGTRSVGINLLDQEEPSFIRIAEFTKLLLQRWGLERFGARTDELLRNSLYVLAANRLTLLEITPLLTNAGFRGKCLKKVSNAEVRHYFEFRYDRASEPMQATMREPILNRTSAFTADPQFRPIVGQEHSTFSMVDAMDNAKWIIVDIPKGRLGEQAVTLGSLIFAMAKNALFGRTNREGWTIYVDEVQNFLVNDAGIESVFSEARKFGVSVVSANQYLSQYPDDARAAILSVGTKVFFQLSPPDAAQIAQALDGGRFLGERLKNLPHRHFIVKAGSERWDEGYVPLITMPSASADDLSARVDKRYARSHEEVEREITERQNAITPPLNEIRDVWE